VPLTIVPTFPDRNLHFLLVPRANTRRSLYWVVRGRHYFTNLLIFRSALEAAIHLSRAPMAGEALDTSQLIRPTAILSSLTLPALWRNTHPLPSTNVSLQTAFATYGVTISLPSNRRASMRSSPSSAPSNGTTSSISGSSLPSSTNLRSETRSLRSHEFEPRI
jgi:hypothetical protein